MISPNNRLLEPEPARVVELNAQAKEETETSALRRHVRQDVLLPARLYAGGRIYDAQIDDISLGGARITLPENLNTPLTRNQDVTLTVEDLGSLSAEIMWVSKSHAGLKFTDQGSLKANEFCNTVVNRGGLASQSRRAVLWGAELRHADDVRSSCDVLNISTGGAKLRLGKELAIGDFATIIIPECGEFPVAVAWQRGRELGLRFLEGSEIVVPRLSPRIQF